MSSSGLKVGNVRIIPLGFESLGVRSMATLIETPDVTVLVDPGVSIPPKRYNLPPSDEEWEALEEVRGRIQRVADRADVVTISHYHYDHYTPFTDREYEACDPGTAEELYRDKLILMKHPTEDINRSQAGRAQALIEGLDELGVDYEFADGKRFEFGETVLEFSPPLPHGPEGTKLGYVLGLRITHRDRVIVHASDVQGPVYEPALEWILKRDPNLVLISGPPTYLLGFRFSSDDLKKAVENLRKLASKSGQIILDHHLLRDKNYRDRLSEVYEESDNVSSAAEVLGKEERLLEAYRDELGGEE
ncbi:MBL fold metallo-hydrolase [Methanopyrus sp. SNP6]|uniref:MBL fold metallo-hydrolase n=1 Tax=Methanopyrus sp. SNP6 TaxID=1937005 RepID=UPI001AEF7AD0|nr:MBL fold metallo-hydrolase [Methanopyrus sp. SNP6]